MAGAGKSGRKSSASRAASHKLAVAKKRTVAKGGKRVMSESRNPAADGQAESNVDQIRDNRAHRAARQHVGERADGDADRNVDQIRDILFGGQMRDYERRFQEFGQRLEAEMTRLRESQDKRLAQMDKRIDTELEKLSRQIRQELTDRTRADDDLETRVQQAARTARGEINNALEGLRGELGSLDERLRDALAELGSALDARASEAASSLSRTNAELRSEKVGREDLAAMLTELGLRLKGDFDLPSN